MKGFLKSVCYPWGPWAKDQNVITRSSTNHYNLIPSSLVGYWVLDMLPWVATGSNKQAKNRGGGKKFLEQCLFLLEQPFKDLWPASSGWLNRLRARIKWLAECLAPSDRNRTKTVSSDMVRWVHRKMLFLVLERWQIVHFASIRF